MNKIKTTSHHNKPCFNNSKPNTLNWADTWFPWRFKCIQNLTKTSCQVMRKNSARRGGSSFICAVMLLVRRSECLGVFWRHSWELDPTSPTLSSAINLWRRYTFLWQKSSAGKKTKLENRQKSELETSDSEQKSFQCFAEWVLKYLASEVHVVGWFCATWSTSLCVK